MTIINYFEQKKDTSKHSNDRHEISLFFKRKNRRECDRNLRLIVVTGLLKPKREKPKRKRHCFNKVRMTNA